MTDPVSRTLTVDETTDANAHLTVDDFADLTNSQTDFGALTAAAKDFDELEQIHHPPTEEIQ